MAIVSLHSKVLVIGRLWCVFVSLQIFGGALEPRYEGNFPEAPKPNEQPRDIVKTGDTLWAIAKAQHGEGSKYWTIFEANRPILERPGRIYPGQMLQVPFADKTVNENGQDIRPHSIVSGTRKTFMLIARRNSERFGGVLQYYLPLPLPIPRRPADYFPPAKGRLSEYSDWQPFPRAVGKQSDLQ